MQLYTTIADVPETLAPSAVAIGKFDGVHAGHRRVIGELLSVGAERSLSTVAVTFDRHPLALLNPEACPVPLVSNDQKVELLAGTGLDATLMLAFDRDLSEMAPEDFVQRILVDTLGARVVLVGSDFRFGAKGSGTAASLVEFGDQHGFEVRLVDDVRVTAAVEGEQPRRASSTWIRELLGKGLISEAATLLGHLPAIRSIVVPGAQRGRELGYPTANLSPEIEGFVPTDGVYAAWLTVDGQKLGAAVSIGNNPTFEGVPDRQVEAHVLDKKIDLYGKRVELAFVEYIRPMSRFDSADALVTQMGRDEQRIREILGYPAATRPVITL